MKSWGLSCEKGDGERDRETARALARAREWSSARKRARYRMGGREGGRGIVYSRCAPRPPGECGFRESVQSLEIGGGFIFPHRHGPVQHEVTHRHAQQQPLQDCRRVLVVCLSRVGAPETAAQKEGGWERRKERRRRRRGE